MIDKLVEFLKENIDSKDIELASDSIWEERIPLRIANYKLYAEIIDLIDEFISDNDLSEDWFDDLGLDIEELFEQKLM